MEMERTIAERERQDGEAAIQAVTEFIRAEEERVLREVEELRRREEEQRAREDEQRRQREEQRIAAVNRKFVSLNAELEALDITQHVLISERQDFETEMLQKERHDAFTTLSLRHPSEISSLASQFATLTNSTEAKFEQEFQTLMSEERSIEDNYVKELLEYWRGKPDGEIKIREARDGLKWDQTRTYRIWEDWRCGQVLAQREEERRKMDALRAKQKAEIRAAESRAKMERLEWKRKVFAESRWVFEVGRERAEMLVEMEGREYAGGE
jgi:hypothetical protein